jgi:hypothetical protein
MKTKTFLLSLMMICIVPAISYGQVGNLLRNKAAKVLNAGSKTLNKEVDNKIDTAAQKEVDNEQQKADQDREENKAEEGQDEAGKGGNRQSKGFNLGGLMGGKVTAKYNESYSFNNRIYMQMEAYNKKDVTKMDYYIYFSDTNPSAGFEMKIIGTSESGEQVGMLTSSVFDAENKVFLILSDLGTVKMGIISEVPDESTLQNQSTENINKPTITKTGNSKVIAGYKCDEYLYKDPESKEHGILWVTKDLKLRTDNRTFSKAGLPAYYGDPDLEGGIILAMESYNEKNELQMKSETKEINMNYNHTISVIGYPLRQMNFNQAGTQNKK